MASAHPLIRTAFACLWRHQRTTPFKGSLGPCSSLHRAALLKAGVVDSTAKAVAAGRSGGGRLRLLAHATLHPAAQRSVARCPGLLDELLAAAPKKTLALWVLRNLYVCDHPRPDGTGAFSVKTSRRCWPGRTWCRCCWCRRQNHHQPPPWRSLLSGPCCGSGKENHASRSLTGSSKARAVLRAAGALNVLGMAPRVEGMAAVLSCLRL